MGAKEKWGRGRTRKKHLRELRAYVRERERGKRSVDSDLNECVVMKFLREERC